MAAVLACGPGAGLSHRAAGDLHGLRRNRTRIEVTQPKGRTAPHGITVYRSRMVDPVDFTVIDAIHP